jgi:ribosomal protein L23
MTVLISPILTEKAAQQMSTGLYVMTVSTDATKNSIAQELKKELNLDAVSVRIVNLPAKDVKFKRRPGTQPARRKAYIQLAKGQKLPGFELPKPATDKDQAEKEDK